MLIKGISSRYYLFSLANLSAAFGGGVILGKGVGIIDLPYFHASSLLAFFIGTLLGLIFLQNIPEKLSKSFAKFFSINGGVISLILLYIYQNYSINTKLNGEVAILFFILFCVRFSFWFYSRVMRASQASGHQQSIAWVELGYYLGMALGLMIWKLLGINLELSTALLIDACFQFMAGFLDYRSNAFPDAIVAKVKQSVQNYHQEADSVQWCWKLASAVVFFTIGIQIVIFNSSHHVVEALSSYMIGLFYLGVATAAYICSQYKILITWNDQNKWGYIQTRDGKINLNLIFFSLISTLAVIGTIYLVNLKDLNYLFNTMFICFFVFMASFFYEVISLALLDRLGYEEKTSGASGMIMRTYGLMGLGSAVSLWGLDLINNYFSSSIITALVCMCIGTVLICKRHVRTNTTFSLQEI